MLTVSSGRRLKATLHKVSPCLIGPYRAGKAPALDGAETGTLLVFGIWAAAVAAPCDSDEPKRSSNAGSGSRRLASAAVSKNSSFDGALGATGLLCGAGAAAATIGGGKAFAGRGDAIADSGGSSSTLYSRNRRPSPQRASTYRFRTGSRASSSLET